MTQSEKRKARLGIFVGGVRIAECSKEVQAEACLSIDRRMRGLLKQGAPVTRKAPVNVRELVPPSDQKTD